MSRSVVPRRAVAALILAALCWGVGTVVSKQAVAEVPPLTLLPIQLAISLAFLTPIARRRSDHLPVGHGGRLIGGLGLLNPGLAYALSLAGLTMITASLSVLLWAAEPILILILASVILGERAGNSIVLLSAVAIGGLAIVLYDPSASGAALGVVLTIAGVGCCAAYTTATRKWLPSIGSTLGVVLAQQAYGLVFALVLLAVSGLAGQGGDAERAQPSWYRKHSRLGRPLLRRRLLVLPNGASLGARVIRGRVLLPDPGFRDGHRLPIRRPSWSGAMGRRRDRHWCGGRDHGPGRERDDAHKPAAAARALGGHDARANRVTVADANSVL
jgi:drug/metabolite transporter (DMT)-like permease